MDIAELLAFSVKNKASDLHLSAGLPPMIRVDGDVRRINIPALDHKQVHALVYDIMSDKQRRDFEAVSYTHLDVYKRQAANQLAATAQPTAQLGSGDAGGN